MARPKGFEPLTPRFVVWCSIQLSYGRAPGKSARGPILHRPRRGVLPSDDAHEKQAASAQNFAELCRRRIGRVAAPG